MIAATTADVLRAALARDLPARTVPEHRTVLNALPRTSYGEIDWPAFPHPTVAGSAVPDGAANLTKTPIERTVAEV